MPKPPMRETRLHPRVSEGRPLQLTDLDRTGKKLATDSFSKIGSELNSRIDAGIVKAQNAVDSPGSSDTYRRTSQNDLNTLREVKSMGVTDRPLTVSSAANRRVKAVKEGVQRASTTGDIRRGTTLPEVGATRSGLPASVGWYIDHSDDIDRSARAYDFHTPTAIDSSAGMSPQNGPDNEKAAVTALMQGHRNNHPVTARTDVGAKAIGVPGVGHSKQFADLSPDEIRGIGKQSMTEHVSSSTSLTALGKGGTELQTGVKVLRGEVKGHELGADTAKVPSYREDIQNAHAADANVRGEYFRRAHEAFTDKPYFEQPTVFGEEWEKDPYGKAQSTEGILNPGGNTAEDTWMQAISLGQRNEKKPIDTGKGSGRLGKALGSNDVVQAVSARDVYPTPVGSKNVTGDEVRHAVNNAATIKAAKTLSKQAEARGRNVGAGVPAMMVQETGWTEYRIDQGKDPLWEDALKMKAAPAPGIPVSGRPGAKKGSTKKTDAALGGEEERAYRRDFKKKNPGKDVPLKVFGKDAKFVQDSLF